MDGAMHSSIVTLVNRQIENRTCANVEFRKEIRKSEIVSPLEISLFSIPDASRLLESSYLKTMDTSQFLYQPADYVLCIICSKVLMKPVSCREGHTYCRHCIETQLSVNPKCPGCPDTRSTLSSDMLTTCTNIEQVPPFPFFVSKSIKFDLFLFAR